MLRSSQDYKSKWLCQALISAPHLEKGGCDLLQGLELSEGQQKKTKKESVFILFRTDKKTVKKKRYLKLNDLQKQCDKIFNV